MKRSGGQKKYGHEGEQPQASPEAHNHNGEQPLASPIDDDTIDYGQDYERSRSRHGNGSFELSTHGLTADLSDIMNQAPETGDISFEIQLDTENPIFRLGLPNPAGPGASSTEAGAPQVDVGGPPGLEPNMQISGADNLAGAAGAPPATVRELVLGIETRAQGSGTAGAPPAAPDQWPVIPPLTGCQSSLSSSLLPSALAPANNGRDRAAELAELQGRGQVALLMQAFSARPAQR